LIGTALVSIICPINNNIHVHTDLLMTKYDTSNNECVCRSMNPIKCLHAQASHATCPAFMAA